MPAISKDITPAGTHALTAATKRRYRPRRARSANPPPFQITPRDIDIVRHVARHRFLRSDHIQKLVPGSDKNILHRLKGLYDHAYLDRPDCQYDFYKVGGGSSPAVYALADRGAKLLMHADGFVQGERVNWAQKNKTAGRPFLEHTLGIADLAVALEAGVAKRSDIALLGPDELREHLPPETQRLKQPYSFTVPVIYAGERVQVSTVPDYAFVLRDTVNRKQGFYMVEIDTGSMPVTRKSLKQTSILRKFLAYMVFSRTGQHRRQFGFQQFRVLVVTSSEERVANMQVCLRDLTKGQGSPLFWFAHGVEENILEYSWIDGLERVQILMID